MAYTIQIFHPESGFYLNTNHVSDDLDELRQLVESDAFAGPRFQIVDDDGVTRYGPVVRDRSSHLTINELADIMGVPVSDHFEPPHRDDEDPAF